MYISRKNRNKRQVNNNNQGKSKEAKLVRTQVEGWGSRLLGVLSDHSNNKVAERNLGISLTPYVISPHIKQLCISIFLFLFAFSAPLFTRNLL
jgi:hypothetical protein